MERIAQEIKVGNHALMGSGDGAIVLSTPWQPMQSVRRQGQKLVDLWIAQKYNPQFHMPMGYASQFDPGLIRAGMRMTNCFWGTEGKKTGWLQADLKGSYRWVENDQWAAVAWLPTPGAPGD